MIFYLKNLLSKQAEGVEAMHLFSTRVHVGDSLEITDLKGLLATCNITYVDKKKHIITYDIVTQQQHKKPVQITLIQAKTDKQYIEKMCELAPIANITELYLFESEFSPQQQKLNIDRLQQIMIRSCEQCHNLFLPNISYFPENEKTELFEKNKPIILHGNGQNIEIKTQQNSEKITIAVGAEGGWSDSEITLFKELDLSIISVGDIVLPAWLAGYTFIKKIQR